MTVYGPLVWVVSVMILMYLALKAVQLTKDGKRVSGQQEARELTAGILQSVDNGQKRRARMLLRRLKFLCEQKGVTGIDLESLTAIVDNFNPPLMSAPGATQTSSKPTPSQSAIVQSDDQTTCPDDEQLERDLHLLQTRLKKSKQLTLDLRTELLDIESVITRLQKRTDR
ncbi:MAG: hypothetical protein V1738_02610 [Patescibacteria group bacterium]